jgi:hypothetical protein
MWIKPYNDHGFMIFSTIFLLLFFFHIYVWINTSLTFLIFCLDKGVHFIPPRRYGSEGPLFYLSKYTES